MATTSTLPSLKTALVDELNYLEISTGASVVSASTVPAHYSEPPADRKPTELMYLATTNTVDESERRMASRQRRENWWIIPLVIESVSESDPALAEARAFAIWAEVEDWLADNSQPHEWANSSLTPASQWLVPSSLTTNMIDGPEGQTKAILTVELEYKERLQ